MRLEGSLKELESGPADGEQPVIRAAGQEIWEDDRGVERQALAKTRRQNYFEQNKMGTRMVAALFKKD